MVDEQLFRNLYCVYCIHTHGHLANIKFGNRNAKDIAFSQRWRKVVKSDGAN